jgi:hypothetical protein
VSINSLIIVSQPVVAEINSIRDDRRLINEAASVIRNLWPQIDAAKTYIEAGRVFKNLHSLLTKNSRHDRTRIGWVRAWNEPEGKFGCDRRHAERCIRVFDTFGHLGHACPTWKLPSGLRALDLLATFKLPLACLSQYLLSGTIGPNTSVRAVRKFGETLGIIEPKLVSKKSAEPAPVITLSEFERYWLKLSEDDRLEFFDNRDVVEVLAAKSLRAKLQARAGGKVLLLPAPAKPPTDDELLRIVKQVGPERAWRAIEAVFD